MRSFRRSLLSFTLLVSALPAVAAEPSTEQLPPVDTGEEAIKGDYLDLREPAEAAGGEAKKKPGRKVELRMEKFGPRPGFLELKKGEAVQLAVTLVGGGCTSLTNKELKLDLKLEAGTTVEKELKANEAGKFVLACPGGKTSVGLTVK